MNTTRHTCKEFDIPCGYPANAGEIAMRMDQGFSVFILGWGEPGFEAVEIGRKRWGRGRSLSQTRHRVA